METQVGSDGATFSFCEDPWTDLILMVSSVATDVTDNAGWCCT